MTAAITLVGGNAREAQERLGERLMEWEGLKGIKHIGKGWGDDE